MLDKIRVILVNTSHPGNIGSAARAMKNMGLSRLYLVNPKVYPDPDCEALAAHANDILENTQVFTSLNAAIQDCSLVIASSSRHRKLPWPLLNAREASQKLFETAKLDEVALVFGNEQSGLSNEELQQAHFHANIMANPEYPSLNLAQAVQIFAYEIYQAAQNQASYSLQKEHYASLETLQHCEKHFQKVLHLAGFLEGKQTRRLLSRVRRLFYRAQPYHSDIEILRGVFTQLQAQLENKQ